MWWMLSSVNFALRGPRRRLCRLIALVLSGSSIADSGDAIIPIGITPDSVIIIFRIP